MPCQVQENERLENKKGFTGNLFGLNAIVNRFLDLSQVILIFLTKEIGPQAGISFCSLTDNCSTSRWAIALKYQKQEKQRHLSLGKKTQVVLVSNPYLFSNLIISQCLIKVIISRRKPTTT